MRSGLGPLSSGDIQHIAAELKVKPEEVAEMETRLTGREIAFEPEQDDEEGYAPVHYLADEESEPAGYSRPSSRSACAPRAWRRRSPASTRAAGASSKRAG